MKAGMTTLVLAASACMASAADQAPAQAQDANLARNLAATCANCHGGKGQGAGAIAPLAGQPADKTIAAMAGYKSGARGATLMHQIAKGYTDEQIGLVAVFYARQAAPSGQAVQK